MSRLDRYFTVFLIGFVVVFLALGMFYYDYRWSILRFPLGAGIVVVLLGVLHLWRGWDHAPAQPADTHPPPRAVWYGAAWSAAVLPVIFLFGYVIGLPLYTFVYLTAHGQGWRLAGALALGVLALVYVGFVQLLGVPLPLFPLGFDH